VQNLTISNRKPLENFSLNPGSFLWLIAPFARKPISSARLGSNIVLLSDPDHIRQAAKLEKEGKLSRQSFTHAIAAPILDEDIFTCPESE